MTPDLIALGHCLIASHHADGLSLLAAAKQLVNHHILASTSAICVALHHPVPSYTSLNCNKKACTSNGHNSGDKTQTTPDTSSFAVSFKTARQYQKDSNYKHYPRKPTCTELQSGSCRRRTAQIEPGPHPPLGDEIASGPLRLVAL